MKGGYINIDASGLDIAKSTSQTISGIYKKILNAKKANKPIFLYNVVHGSFGKIAPICAFYRFREDNEIVCNILNFEIIISSNDNVKVNEN